MIAQRFGFTRDFTPQGGTEVRRIGIPAVFPTEERDMVVERCSLVNSKIKRGLVILVRNAG
jgi:hypothetical protein